jgi:hypothetical protein
MPNVPLRVLVRSSKRNRAIRSKPRRPRLRTGRQPLPTSRPAPNTGLFVPKHATTGGNGTKFPSGFVGRASRRPREWATWHKSPAQIQLVKDPAKRARRPFARNRPFRHPASRTGVRPPIMHIRSLMSTNIPYLVVAASPTYYRLWSPLQPPPASSRVGRATTGQPDPARRNLSFYR